MVRGMGIDTPLVSLFEGLLALLNRIPIGSREVRVAGHRLFPDTMDRWLAALVWKFVWSGSSEAAFFRSVVKPGMVAADVGANLGLHTLTLAQLVGSTGRVHAVEPEPRNFRALQRALEASGHDYVRLHRAAAGAEPGKGKLYVSQSNRGDHRGTPGLSNREQITVEQIALDHHLGERTRLDFVKLDVQGAEGAVLIGMQKLLLANPQIIILCELSPALLADNDSTFDSFFAPVLRAGLATYTLGPDAQLTEATPASAWARAEQQGYTNVIFCKAHTA